MIRYKLKSPPPPVEFYKRREAFMILRVDSAEHRAKIEYEGDPVLIDQVEWAMVGNMGASGRSVDPDRATAIDLSVAVTQPQMKGFEPELVEGHEILAAYLR